MEVSTLIKSIQKQRLNLLNAHNLGKEDNLKTEIIFAKASSEKLNEAMFDNEKQNQVYQIGQEVVADVLNHLAEEKVQISGLCPVFPSQNVTNDILVSYLIWPDDDLFLSEYPFFLHQSYVKALDNKNVNDDQDVLEKDITTYYGRYGNPQYLPFLRYDYLQKCALQQALNEEKENEKVYKIAADDIASLNVYLATTQEKMLTKDEESLAVSYLLWPSDEEFSREYENSAKNGHAKYGNLDNLSRVRRDYLKSNLTPVKEEKQVEKVEVVEETQKEVEVKETKGDDQGDYTKLALAAVQKIKDLTMRNQNLMQTNKDLEAMVATKESQIKQLTEENAAKDDQIKQAEASIKSIQERDRILEETLKAKETVIAEQQTLINHYKEFFAVNESALNELRNALDDEPVIRGR